MCFFDICHLWSTDRSSHDGSCSTSSNYSPTKIALSITTCVAAIFSAIGFLATSSPIALGFAIVLGLITFTIWPSTTTGPSMAAIPPIADIFSRTYSPPAVIPQYGFSSTQHIVETPFYPHFGEDRILLPEQQGPSMMVAPTIAPYQEPTPGEQRILLGQNTVPFETPPSFGEQRVSIRET